MSYWDQSMFGVKTRNTIGIMEVSLTALFNFLITFKHKVSYWDQSIFGVMTRNTTGIMESWKLVVQLSLTFLLHLSRDM